MAFDGADDYVIRRGNQHALKSPPAFAEPPSAGPRPSACRRPR